MSSARRSATYKVLSRYNSAGLARRHVLQLTLALLESEHNARTFETEKSDTGRNRQPLKRAAKKLAKKDHAEILEWLSSDKPYAYEIHAEVLDHIRRAGGDGLESGHAVRKALTAIGNGDPVPPPSPEAIAALAHTAATPFSSKRAGGPEADAGAADAVLELANWFWLLTGKCPTYSNTEPELIKGGFQIFINEWVDAGCNVDERQWRRHTASLHRIREAVKFCQKRTCRNLGQCRAEPRCATIECCSPPFHRQALTYR